MTTSTLKRELHKTIDGISDKAILQAVYTLLQQKPSATKPLKALSASALLKRSKLSEKNIQEGKTIKHTDVKKRFK